MKYKTLGLTLLLGGGLVLSGCQNIDFTPSNEIQSLVTTKTMAFQATTAISLVGGLNTSTTFSAMGNMDVSAGPTVKDPVDTSVDTVLPTSLDTEIPVATLDLLFTNGSGFNVEQKTSDREDFTNMEVITFNVMDQETTTYTLYYNVAPLEEDDEVLPGEDIVEEEPSEEASEEVSQPVLERHGEDGDKDEEDHDGPHHDENQEDEVEDEDEDEDDEHQGNNGNHGGNGHGHTHRDHEHGNDQVKIRGIAVVGDEEYVFMSKTEIDTDSDEQEIESKFMIFKDEANFISIKQEITTSGVEGEVDYEYEEEFKYFVVKDGEIANKFKLEIESEAEEETLEVKIDGLKYEVEYEHLDGRVFLHINVRGQGEFVYEKVVTTNEETLEVSVEYILQ